MTKKYRFFYHYRVKDHCISVHFRNQCFPAKHLRCFVECETKWNKRQPRLVMRGFCEQVMINGDTATIL